ncbi:hypothetical protein [Catellatospora vulcania]|uniref:hypothetical protein n=1 Tax=Catellatospora vulcania TaxID=1460450 RepID=UPI0012D422DF|nr:hypothetical protein [Catellatospora vulcania]
MSTEPPGESGTELFRGHRTAQELEDELRHALRGVELTEHDTLVIRWIVRVLDLWTVRALLSLLHRLRRVARGAA